MEKKQLYIFTMYGGLTNVDFKKKEPLVLLPGRLEECQKLQQKGHLLAMANNEGGCAFGFSTPTQSRAKIMAIADQLGIPGELVKISFGHPEPKFGYEEYAEKEHMRTRKPNPGMIDDLMEETGYSPAETWMIGVRDEDEEAARRAGCNYMPASQFFAGPHELLIDIYDLYQKCIQVTGDHFMELVIQHSGSGRLASGQDVYCDWWEMKDALAAIRGVIALATGPEPEPTVTPAPAPAPAGAAPADDFDPFLEEDLP